eukprot:490677_1
MYLLPSYSTSTSIETIDVDEPPTSPSHSVTFNLVPSNPFIVSSEVSTLYHIRSRRSGRIVKITRRNKPPSSTIYPSKTRPDKYIQRNVKIIRHNKTKTRSRSHFIVPYDIDNHTVLPSLPSQKLICLPRKRVDSTINYKKTRRSKVILPMAQHNVHSRKQSLAHSSTIMYNNNRTDINDIIIWDNIAMKFKCVV